MQLQGTLSSYSRKEEDMLETKIADAWAVGSLTLQNLALKGFEESHNMISHTHTNMVPIQYWILEVSRKPPPDPDPGAGIIFWTHGCANFPSTGLRLRTHIGRPKFKQHKHWIKDSECPVGAF